MVPTKSKYADSKSSAYLRGTRLKTKKYQTVILAYLRYANYRTLKFYHGHENALIFEMALPEMKQKLLSSVPLVRTVKP